VSKERPVNLQLRTIKFPITAIVSILHRTSGVILFLVIPFLLCALAASLHSPEQFERLQTCLAHPVSKFFLWVLLAALLYHLFAGIRHLVMDFGFCEEMESGRRSALWVFIFTIVFTILIGIWLWIM